MQPGDVLYLPRGTVCSVGASDEGSTHIRLSLQRRMTWGNLAQQVLEVGAGGRPATGCAAAAAAAGEMRSGMRGSCTFGGTRGVCMLVRVCVCEGGAIGSDIK